MIEKDILLMWKGLSRPGIRNCSRRGKNAEDQARCNCLNGLYLLDRSMTGIRRPCFIPLIDLLKLGLQDLGSTSSKSDKADGAFLGHPSGGSGRPYDFVAAF